MSHGCRSGLAVDDKTGTATGALVSVENYMLLLLSTTDSSTRDTALGRSAAFLEAAVGSGDGRTDESVWK